MSLSYPAEVMHLRETAIRVVIMTLLPVVKSIHRMKMRFFFYYPKSIHQMKMMFCLFYGKFYSTPANISLSLLHVLNFPFFEMIKKCQ